MSCPRCHGLMYLERLCDFGDISYAWKCINCGALLDRTITNNKQREHQRAPSSPRLPAPQACN